MPRNKHSRQSLRLKGYDYSQAGCYFVTICCQNRRELFGHIANGKMILNDAGLMVEKWYHELENKYPDVICGPWVVMPNHIHIIIIQHSRGEKTAPVEPEAILLLDDSAETEGTISLEGRYGRENKVTGSTLGRVVQWLKTMTTNEYIRGVKNLNWPPFEQKVWQRNYWEHIIRSEASFDRIAGYIDRNPAAWERDALIQKR